MINRRQILSGLLAVAAFFGANPVAASLPRAIELPPLNPIDEWPFQPETVFVVSSAVWNDFVVLREKNEGWICVNGFHWECEENERSAIAKGRLPVALHWRAVRELAIRYSWSPVSAIEVDGHVFREIAPSGGFSPPPDSELKRVWIGEISARQSKGCADCAPLMSYS